jgi:hypothetical protein
VDVLVIARGLGLGHITRDLRLIAKLVDQGVSCELATYGDATRFAEERAPVPVHRLRGAGPFDPVLLTDEVALLSHEKPHLIVSDEEVFVAALARGLGVSKVAYITNWFPAEGLALDLVNTFDALIFPDLASSFPVPSGLRCPVHWTGPLFDQIDRANDTPYPQTEQVVITAGGGQATDVEFWRKVLVGISQRDPETPIRAYAGDLSPWARFLASDLGLINCIVEDRYQSPDAAFSDASLVITRGGHTTAWELMVRGRYSLVMPLRRQINPANILYARHMERLGFARVVLETDSQQSVTEAIGHSLRFARTHHQSLLQSAQTFQSGWPAALDVIMSLLETSRETPT